MKTNQLRLNQLLSFSDQEAPHAGRMSNIAGLLFVLAAGLIPINIFPSGGFQIVDIFISLLIAYVIIDKNLIEGKIKKHILLLLPFVVWAFLVTTGYYLVFAETYILYNFIYPLYGLIMLYVFTHIWSKLLAYRAYWFFYLMIGISIISVFLFKGHHEWEGVRYSFSFNNPNQLGLYALMLQAAMILILRKKTEDNIRSRLFYLIDIFVILCAHYFLLMAISRGAMAAFLIVDICLLRNSVSKELFFPVLGSILLAVSILLLVNPNFIQERIETRGQERFSSEAFEERMETAVLNPLRDLQGWRILVGTAQVPSARFSGRQVVLMKQQSGQVEVHNMFGNVLWRYGVIGLVLYAFWIFSSIFKMRTVDNALWIWAGILTFGVSGVLIRSRMYWMLLGLLFALWNLKVKDEKLVLGLDSGK